MHHSIALLTLYLIYFRVKSIRMSVWMKINLNVIRRLKMALLNKAVFVDLQSKD